MENSNDILDDLLSRISNQDLLKLDDEAGFIDSVMDNIPDSAARTLKIRGWVVVFRAISSMAAALVLGLFLMQGSERVDGSISTKNTTQSHAASYMPSLPCADKNSTPRELYKCYTEQRQLREDRLNFINQLKKKTP